VRPIAIVGVVLIVLGLLALAYQGITYTRTERVVDLGPLKVEAKKKETVPLPPLVGAVAVVTGIVLVVAGRRR
jgi:uncharacterized membrane protein HdeD (DUF308 family)